MQIRLLGSQLDYNHVTRLESIACLLVLTDNFLTIHLSWNRLIKAFLITDLACIFFRLRTMTWLHNCWCKVLMIDTKEQSNFLVIPGWQALKPLICCTANVWCLLCSFMKIVCYYVRPLLEPWKIPTILWSMDLAAINFLTYRRNWIVWSSRSQWSCPSLVLHFLFDLIFQTGSEERDNSCGWFWKPQAHSRRFPVQNLVSLWIIQSVDWLVCFMDDVCEFFKIKLGEYVSWWT